MRLRLLTLVVGLTLAGCSSNAPTGAAACAGPLHLSAPIWSSGKPVEILATFKKGITFKKANQFADVVIELNIDRCAPFTEIMPVGGRVILSVLASPSQRRRYRPYVISYLDATGMFSSVRAVGPR